MPTRRCPACGRENAPSRAACIRCGANLRGLDPRLAGIPAAATPEQQTRAESIASVLYLLSFFVSMAGGAAVIFLLQQLMGDRVLESDALLIWGFMGGAAVTFVATIYGVRRWKARAQGIPFKGGVVHEPRPSPVATASRKELIVFAVLLVGLSFFLVYYFNDWEQSGGERTINAILYGLYMLLGKWGLAALLWIGAGALVWQARKRPRQRRIARPRT
jgi:hypothetical protein